MKGSADVKSWDENKDFKGVATICIQGEIPKDTSKVVEVNSHVKVCAMLYDLFSLYDLLFVAKKRNIY